MKKAICLILVIFLLCGCGKDKSEIKTPVNFYYTNTEIHYNSLNGVLSAEVRDGTGYKENLVGLLDLYFAGPLSDEFISPFPAGTITMSIFREGAQLNVELSNEFAELEGLDLTIACACLTKTAAELTGCEVVRIYATDNALDGNPSITMSASDLLMLDEII